MTHSILVLASLTIGCAHQENQPGYVNANDNRHSSGAPQYVPPGGSPSNFSIDPASLASSVTVLEPMICDGLAGPGSEAYIRIVSSEGSRTLAFGKHTGDSRGLDGCRDLVALQDGRCPVINAEALLAAAGNEGIPSFQRLGSNPCGHFDYDSHDRQGWSLMISDWKNAESAVRAVVKAMIMYNVVGELGVGVEGLRSTTH